MNVQFQTAVKKLLQEYGHKIEEDAVLAGAHISHFIEIAVHKFGASTQQAAQGLAYPSQLPRLLLEKLESLMKDIPVEIEKVEKKIESIIKPVSAPVQPPVVQPAPETPTTTSSTDKGEMSFSVTE